MFSQSLLVLTSILAFASARPAADVLARGINANSCSNPVAGLSPEGCRALSKAGFASQGKNDHGPNGLAWVGNQGPNVFELTNNAGVPLVVALWNKPGGDYQAMCMNVRQALVTVSVDPGKTVPVSVANGVSGSMAGIYNGITNLGSFGGVNNVWGEFTTGQWATFDVSRNVNMAGNHMSAKVTKGQTPGCVSEYTKTSSRCVFHCTDGTNACQFNYALENCAINSQPGATIGQLNGKDEGGCQGWANGGTIAVSFLD